jgi:hypothetical protein
MATNRRRLQPLSVRRTSNAKRSVTPMPSAHRIPLKENEPCPSWSPPPSTRPKDRPPS